MRFNNEVLRQQHPQASRIPLDLWNDIFHQYLNENYLPLMQAASEQCLSILETLNHSLLNEQEKNQVWTLIAFCHPNLSFEVLDQISTRLNLSESRIFRLVSSLGNLPYLEHLVGKTTIQNFPTLLANDSFLIFAYAAQEGHLNVLRFLEEKAQGQLQEMIAACHFEVFYSVSAKGHLSTLQYIEEKAPLQLQAIIAAYGVDIFRNAARNGHLHILQYLEEKAPGQLQAMIAGEDFVCFRNAARNGHPPILHYLAEKAPNQLPAMIAARNFFAFSQAAQQGHLNVMHFLEEKAPEQLQAMIAAKEFEPFHLAAQSGFLKVLQYLEEKAPEQLQAMISSISSVTLHTIAGNDHLNVLQYLEEKAPEQFQDTIATGGCFAFYCAVGSKQHAVAQYLLHHAVVLAYADAHVREYRAVVVSFITEQLANLHLEKAQAEEANAQIVYNVDEAVSKRCFYMLRHLIRRNDPALLDEIRFLLSIPAVKNLAHRQVNGGESNELLLLALSMDNAAAAEVLLSLPEVYALAQQHHYYRNEMRGELDLQTLARNRESSMTALSTGEQKRLKTALDHYNPTLKQEGMVPSLISALKETLQQRYMEQPARIEIKKAGMSEPLELPGRWEDFQTLDLTAEERLAANKAYYQHKDHTAWRYLSKPNPWMHAQAAYVYASEDHSQRWSTFEEYQPFIALLFLAANDEQIPATDGFTLETRLEHFITELALIGRAHNWDDTRIVVDDEGVPIIDEDGQVKWEEYDNLDGDRPSCFSGVKRRLFQSLLGHPMFQILTKQIIETEIRDFVRRHFETVLTKNKPELLQNAWNELIEEGNQDAIATLKVLDVSDEQQKEFLVGLDKKYGFQLTEEPEFIKYLSDSFKFLKPDNDSHAVYFGTRVDLPGLLDKAVGKQLNYAENPHGFLSPPNALGQRKRKREDAECEPELEAKVENKF